MEDRKINIKVVIAEKSYKLNIAPQEEEQVRKAAKVLKKRIKDLRNVYFHQEKQDYLAMMSLLLSVELLQTQKLLEEKQQQQDAVNRTLANKVDELEKMLASFSVKS
ncbi:MAG: cell division protein ZapA [Chitinophagales bacterium]